MKNARMRLMSLAVMTLGLAVAAQTAAAGRAQRPAETDVKVPPAVAEAVKANCPGAAVDKTEVEREAGILLYDFELKAGRGEIEVAEDGTVMDISVIVALKDIPKPAADAILKAAAGAKLGQLEKSEIRAEVRKQGTKGTIVRLDPPKHVYEAELIRGEKRGEVQVAPDGKVVEGAKWGRDSAEPAAPDPAGYHLLKKHVLGGEGGWDYMALDGASRLLYVTHGNAVEILNVDTGVKGEPITGLQGVHGVAFAPERDRGYISNGRGNSVTVFDLKTHKVLAEVSVQPGQNPDSIMYDKSSGRVFTFNGRTANATAIDAATDKVAGTVDIGGKPEFAVTDGKGTIFVNNEDKSEVVAFDAKSLKVLKSWSIAPGEGPSGLAIDLKGRRLFSVCDKVLVVSDYEAGKVVATVPIGEGPDAVRYDPATKLIFASNGEGTLTVVRQESADTYAVLETVTTARGARTMELDPKTHHIFVVTAEYGPAPAPTADHPRPRPTIVPGSFMVLEFGK